jgi:apolipoprotein N-acyltransferase
MAAFAQRIHDLVERHWFILPIAAAVFLILTFHPFNLWLLGVVALVPHYYFVISRPSRSRTQIFLGGLITGGLFAFALSYFTLIQFHWLPEAYLFATAVRFMVIPITLFGGLVCGVASLCYRYVRSDSLVLNALAGAAVYALAELGMRIAFGGYYLGMLGYAATDMPWLMSLSSLGGVLAV